MRVSIVVTGSIANDYLMEFPGRIREQLVDGQLDHISLSFLVDELRIHRGGIGGNIAFGLGKLGSSSYLVGAVGADFADYRSWLEQHSVRTEHVYVSPTKHTARFICTTDADHNQIASFYAGAMAQAGTIDLPGVLGAIGDVRLVVISPNDPTAMLEHTRACRTLGIPFAADPSQQLARMAGPEIRELVEGASLLFTNEYERELLMQKTGWSADEVRSRVGTWVVTLGAKGLSIQVGAEPAIDVPAHDIASPLDPTGVGDACRAGFIAALRAGLDLQRAGELGCTLASYALEAIGTQEYTFTVDDFTARVRATYGGESAAVIDSFFTSKSIAKEYT